VRRYLDTCFRHPLLYLLPATLVLAIAVVSARRAVRHTLPYSAAATVAVNLDPTRARPLGERPLSEQHASLLGELMETDGFVIGAIKRTGLADRLTGGEEDEVVAHEVRRNWSQRAAGPNTVRVRYRCAEPALCPEVVTAILAAYRDEVFANRVLGPRSTVEFYEQQAQTAEQRLRSLPATDPAAASAREIYEELLVKLAGARLDADTAMRDAQSGFRVIAPPKLPAAPGVPIRAALLPLLLGGMMAATIFAGSVVLATWMDTTLRAPDDVLDRLGMKTVAVVPHARRYGHAHAVDTLMPSASRGHLALPGWRRRGGRRALHAEEHAGD
jgi:hypothetical protein